MLSFLEYSFLLEVSFLSRCPWLYFLWSVAVGMDQALPLQRLPDHLTELGLRWSLLLHWFIPSTQRLLGFGVPSGYFLLALA